VFLDLHGMDSTFSDSFPNLSNLHVVVAVGAITGAAAACVVVESVAWQNLDLAVAEGILQTALEETSAGFGRPCGGFQYNSLLSLANCPAALLTLLPSNACDILTLCWLLKQWAITPPLLLPGTKMLSTSASDKPLNKQATGP
jgi:hypothetical protein